jgi:crossover junction endodeoxyribonuclease RuvC
MKIIAFDLSLSNTGYAVGKIKDRKLSIVEIGTIGTKRYAQRSTGFRLNYIAKEVRELYKKHELDRVVKEQSFSNSRIKATQQIFKVNGVWELMTYLADKEDFAELTPSTVKKELTGNGRATKEEVAEAVLAHFRSIMGDSNLKFGNKDESDAVAVLIAYCKKEDLIDG